MERPEGLSALIFDFDGTLFHLDVDWDALRRDVDPAGAGQPLGTLIQGMLDDGDPALSRVTEAELRGVGERRVSDEVVSTLDTLAGRYALAVCTRNSRQAVERAFAGTSMSARILIVGREDTKRLKPDPEAPRRALDALNASAADAAIIGDTYHDVQAARALGASAFVVRNDRLAYQPPGADWYVERISDLLPVLA